MAARETTAERKVAEASEAVAQGQSSARQQVEREYMELKSGLNAQRMQLEVRGPRGREGGAWGVRKGGKRGGGPGVPAGVYGAQVGAQRS